MLIYCLKNSVDCVHSISIYTKKHSKINFISKSKLQFLSNNKIQNGKNAASAPGYFYFQTLPKINNLLLKF